MVLHVLVPRLSGFCRHNLAQECETKIGILPMDIGIERLIERTLKVGIRRPDGIGDDSARHLALQSGSMRQEFAQSYGRSAVRMRLNAHLAQMALEGIIELQLARITQLKNGDRSERLGDGTGPAPV